MENVENGNYESVEQCESDILLVMKNCSLLNASNKEFTAILGQVDSKVTEVLEHTRSTGNCRNGQPCSWSDETKNHLSLIKTISEEEKASEIKQYFDNLQKQPPQKSALSLSDIRALVKETNKLSHTIRHHIKNQIKYITLMHGLISARVRLTTRRNNGVSERGNASESSSRKRKSMADNAPNGADGMSEFTKLAKRESPVSH